MTTERPDDEGEDDLARRHLPMAMAIARIHCRQAPHSDHDSIRSDALLGLLEAIRTWQPKCGKLTTWANKRIAWTILDGLRVRNGRQGSERLRHGKPASLDFESVDSWGQPYTQHDLLSEDEEGFAAVDDSDQAERLTACLPPRDRSILAAYHAGKRHIDLAREHGLCESRISQICSESLQYVRECAGVPS